MKYKSSTKVLSILLSIVMVLGLMPGRSMTALADGTTYNPASTYTGFSELITNDTEVTISEVSGKTWYVIAYDDASSTVTLLSKETFGNKAFHSSSNDYATSEIKTYVDGLTGEGQPLAGISSVISDLTLIDIGTANGLSVTKKIGARAKWWLCSPGSAANKAATVSGASGDVYASGNEVYTKLGVRPALKLNLSSVIFSSESNSFTLKPAHTHSFSYSASGATITAACSADGCTLPPSTEGGSDHVVTMTLSAADETYTGSAYTGASLDSTAWTAAGLTAPTIEYAGRGNTSYTKSTTAPTAAGTYTASITVDTDKTATANFTISPMALTITGATAANRAYDKDSTAVTISAVTFKDSNEQAVSLTLGEDNDYTVTGAMSDANAGDNKEVAVTVTLKNGNYSLATNTTTTTVNISKAAAQTIADVTGSQLYTLTSVSESVAGKMPADAGTLTYTAGGASKTGNVTVSNFAVSATGAVTATLSGGAAGDTVTLPVTISSTNYADSTVNVVIRLTAKSDAEVTISGVPTAAKTYGDADFTLTGSVTNAGTGTGVWTWSTSDDTVFQITPDGATATVRILKKGSATVTAKYESDTTVDSETTAAITVNTKTLTIAAKDQSIFVGGTVPTLSGADFYTVSGLVGEETLTTNPTLAYQKNGEAATPDNTTAGTYDIVPSGAVASDNYSISYTNGTLTISNKGTQTISAENVTATYGDTDKSVSATVTDPATGGGDISYAVKEGSGDYIDVDATTGALTIKKVPADGKAYVTVTAAETATYAQATKDVTVTISKADAIPATVTANTLTYTGSAQVLVTVTGEATGGEMQYTLGTATEATEQYTTSIPAKTEAGTYYVWYKAVGDSNHNDSQEASVEVKINKAVPDCAAPENLTAECGTKVGDIELPEGFAWNSPDSVVMNIGDNDFTVTFTPNDTDNYLTVNDIQVVVKGTGIHHAEVSAECEKDGVVEYWEDGNGNKFSDENGTNQITDEQTVIEKIGHSFVNFLKWVWDGFKSAVIWLMCDNCDQVETIDVPTSIDTVDTPDCTHDGYICHVATIDVAGKIYTTVNVETVDQLGHEWGKPEWTWSDDYSEAAATQTCGRCGETRTETADVAEVDYGNGGFIYTATVTFDGVTYTDERCIDPDTPDEPIPDKPTPDEPTPDKPTPDEPTPDKPTPDEPTPDKPTPDEPTPDKPTPDEPTPNKPTPDEPTPDKPTPDEPTPDKPTPDEPTPDKPTPDEPEPEKEIKGILGDVNDDGQVDSADALMILRNSVGLETFDDTQKFLGDVNEDNENIDSSDALAVLRYSVGLIDIEKIGTPVSKTVA